MKDIHRGYDKKRKLKVRDIRCYSSTEFLFDNSKKYRDVFHRSDVDFIYCEFSLYNLLFEKEDREYQVNLQCIAYPEKEICNLTIDKIATKDENIVYVREGWGNKTKGAFWLKGIYEWKVFIDNELIATKKFYIEDIAGLSIRENPFFNFQSIKLFEDDFAASTRIEDVLDDLLSISDANEIYLLKSQWDSLNKTYLSSTISFESYNSETNRLKLAILSLIDELSDSKGKY